MAQYSQEEVPYSYQVWYLTSISYKNNKTLTCLIRQHFCFKNNPDNLFSFHVLIPLHDATCSTELYHNPKLAYRFNNYQAYKYWRKTFLYYLLFYMKISIDKHFIHYDIFLYDLIMNVIQLTLRLSGLKITEQVVYW